MTGRTIAIGDIHGCATALATLIDAIGPEAGDDLVILGDFIDRGPDSRRVLDQLLSLGGRCRVIPILGNHEEMLLAVRCERDPGTLQAWLHYGGSTTLASYGGIGPDDLPADHMALVESCVSFYETGTHLFLHANYDANEPIDEQPLYTLRWESLRDRMPQRHVSGKTVIVGHTAQESGEILDRGYLKCIDTGCCNGGWLTALDVGSGQGWQANELGQLRDLG